MWENVHENDGNNKDEGGGGGGAGSGGKLKYMKIKNPQFPLR